MPAGWRLFSVFLCLALMVSTFRIFKKESSEPWGSASVVVLTFAVGQSLAEMSGRLLGGVNLQYGRYGEQVVSHAGWVQSVDKFGVVASAAVGLAFCTRQVARHGRDLSISRAPLIALLIVTASSLGMIFNGHSAVSQRQATLALGIACAMLGTGVNGGIRGGTAFAAFVGATSLVMAVINPVLGTRHCRFDKCGPSGVLITGIYSNENALALVLACGLALIIFIPRSKDRMILAISLSSLIWLTGSRTSLLAVVAYWLAIIVMNVVKSRTIKRATLLTLLLGSIIAQVLTTLFAPLTWLTERVMLWQLGFNGVGDSPFFGQGWGGLEIAFQTSAKVAGASFYSMHNQALDIAYSAGLLGVILFVVLVFFMVSRRDDYGDSVIVMLFVISSIGLLERPWSFGTVDWLSWSLIAGLFAGGAHRDWNQWTQDTLSVTRRHSSATQRHRIAKQVRH